MSWFCVFCKLLLNHRKILLSRFSTDLSTSPLLLLFICLFLSGFVIGGKKERKKERKKDEILRKFRKIFSSFYDMKRKKKEWMNGSWKKKGHESKKKERKVWFYGISTIIGYLMLNPVFYIYVVPSISFQTFFVQAFKIVVDSWKFSMLLLYIVRDDWPIFMISGSNELLRQELEYTLLKPGCHCWWIPKMQSGREDTLEERYAIKLCFKLGKNATEMCGMLQTAFRPSCMNRASVFEWHKRFKEARESVRDDERCGMNKEVNTPELIGQRVRVRVTMLRF